MKLDSAPVYEWGGRIIELAADAMRLLRVLPDHTMAPEWRKELDAIRQQTPEVFVHARLIVAQDFTKDDLLRERPEDCPFCHGAMTYRDRGKDIRCRCPLTEAARRGRSLEEDAFDRGIVDALPSVTPDDQMLLRLGV
jgi:hypothetical protein